MHEKHISTFESKKNIKNNKIRVTSEFIFKTKNRNLFTEIQIIME